MIRPAGKDVCLSGFISDLVFLPGMIRVRVNLCESRFHHLFCPKSGNLPDQFRYLVYSKGSIFLIQVQPVSYISAYNTSCLIVPKVNYSYTSVGGVGMPQKVFFCVSTHDMNDLRVNVVRSNKAVIDSQTASHNMFVWEQAQSKGDEAVKKLIDISIQDTKTTVVLIGTNTYAQKWIRYQIFRSMKKGNKLIGVHINRITGRDGKEKSPGPNPFSYVGFMYSPDGCMIIPHEYVDDVWTPFKEYEPYKVKQVPEQHRNKVITLSQIAKTYDWVGNNGKDNFSVWIE